MDFRLGPRSDSFRAEVRQFIRTHLTEEIIESVHTTGTIHSWTIHRALAEKGWLAASWPVDEGGQGRDPFEMLALQEEFTAAGVRADGSLLTMMIANIIRHVGSEAHKRDLLPRVLRGEILLCLGYTEPDSGSDVAAAKTRAVRDGDEWVINGQKMFTTLAHEASYVFLLTRTNTDVPKHQGLTTFLVPLDTPGVEIQPIWTLGGERTNVTFYTDVRVPDSARVGEVDGGWRVMTVALTFERGSGGWDEGMAALGRALQWAQAPVPGSDRRPIDDPPVRERLARWSLEAEVTRLLGYRTAWIAAQGGLPAIEGSMTKLFATESHVRMASDLLDLLGPEGVLQHGEPDAPADGWIEHAHRHAAVTTIFGGTSEVQRSIIAERGLGLSRART